MLNGGKRYVNFPIEKWNHDGFSGLYLGLRTCNSQLRETKETKRQNNTGKENDNQQRMFLHRGKPIFECFNYQGSNLFSV